MFLQLALPVIFTYLGLMTMGLVDLVCVGRISAASISAVGLGTSIFSWFMIFGIGLLTGMEFLIAHSFGAGKGEDCHRSWAQGFWVSWLIGIPLTILIQVVARHLEWLGINPELIGPSHDYLVILSYSLIPVFLFHSSRLYLQGKSVARPAMIILILANVLNAILNWGMVLGSWGDTFGIPARSVSGSALATLIARIFMFLGIFGFHFYLDSRKERFLFSKRIPWDSGIMNQLVRLGLPSALQMTFEVGVFALCTTLAARFTAQAAAAHQIVLNLASTSFMVPLGISSATAVLVGQEVGRQRPLDAVAYGWKGLRISVGFMVLTAALFVVFPEPLVSLYSSDPEVHAIARQILGIVALFQLSDGAQIVAGGALRGVADTRSSMWANLVGHWFFGLPLGVFLGFYRNWGLPGIWTGLALGLTIVAVALCLRWLQRCRELLNQT